MNDYNAQMLRSLEAAHRSMGWPRFQTERRGNYTHVHNYHMRRNNRSSCATNVASCCLTDNPFLVTCLNCARKLGPTVPRGASLTPFGMQVHR